MINKKIITLTLSLESLGLYQYSAQLKKIAGEYTPGRIFYIQMGTKETNYKDFGDSFKLGESSPQDVKNLIEKVKKAIQENKLEEFGYKERHVEEPYQLTLIGDKIKLPWQVTQDEAAIQFFESNFPDLFDLDVDKTRNWLYENIRWPEIRDPSSRSSQHMFDLLTDEVEDLIKEGKNQAYIQDFINGYYAALEESTYDTKADFSAKSKAWQHGYNARKRASFSGDVMRGDALYQAENLGVPSFNSDLQEQSERGLSPDIMEGDRYMGSEQKDFDQAVGEWFLTHGNLDGIIFDKIEEAKQYAESKSRETGANQNLRFNYQTESGTTNILTLASSQATSLINEIKNNFAMMEAERERVAGREPNQREKILVGKVINKIIDQMSTLITKQAESDLTFRAISSEVTKKKKESEDFKNLLETTEGLSDQIKDYFSNQIKNKEKEILELEANKNIVGQTINNFDSLLSDYQQRKLIS
jgi:hypothetical protein